MKIPKFISNYYILGLSGVMIAVMGLTAFFPSPWQDKSIYGYIEPVILYPDEISLIAKLDTGAVTSSLSAKDIHIYEKDGKDYVKFKVSHPAIDETPEYDLPVKHIVKIKKRASKEKSNKSDLRPVVKMPIYFDGKSYNIMVNLIDRSHFSTPMLLGRKALDKFNAIVDSTAQNTIQ
ncbi:RimK/LysX family protein [Nitrosomonas communis]|uniref:ATP-dependent zinc protease family protein n=1 Tax=Nitrosomonas communis TaxID=44574 RepID=UPI0026EB3F9B|nr:RimK/LysX family protein [Nitrosomonas communis]MCO6429077.1 ATP-dependent zinc protease [Nitrosomonas communis]